MFGCNVIDQFGLGYTYDFTLTELSKYSTGTHEIVVSYLIPFKKKKSKHELVSDADEEELNKIDNTLKTNLRNKKKEAKSGEKNQTEKSQDENKAAPPDSSMNKAGDAPADQPVDTPKKKKKVGKKKVEENPAPDAETKENTEGGTPKDEPK